MINPEVQEDLDRRLRRIEGQLRGLQRMVAEPRLCIDILTQMGAVRAALNRCSDLLVRYHLTGCMRETLKGGDTNEIRKRMDELLAIFGQHVR